jgi:hypothetical protein
LIFGDGTLRTYQHFLRNSSRNAVARPQEYQKHTRLHALVDFGGDEFVCKVAKNVDEAKTLVESGFDYVTDVDGLKLFKKRK